MDEIWFIVGIFSFFFFKNIEGWCSNFSAIDKIILGWSAGMPFNKLAEIIWNLLESLLATLKSAKSIKDVEVIKLTCILL